MAGHLYGGKLSPGAGQRRLVKQDPRTEPSCRDQRAFSTPSLDGVKAQKTEPACKHPELHTGHSLRANAACGPSGRSLRASPEGRTVSFSDRSTRVTCDNSSRPCARTPGAVCHAGSGSTTVLGRQITSTLYFHIVLERPSNTSEL